MEQIKIDCKDISTPAQFHKALAKALDFPDYYGENLDAMFDCLTENFTDREVIFYNWHKFQYTMKDYGEKALFVLKCACDENHHLIVTLHP